VVTQDVPGLFSLIAGTLGRARREHHPRRRSPTRADGVAIDTFQVNDPTGEAVTSAAQWARALDALAAVLTHEQSVETLLERRRAGGRTTPAGEAKPKIAVDNRLSDEYTVVEVKCPDRLGLLYLITRTPVGAGPRHRQRAHRDRDRPGPRHLLRPRPQGPALEDPVAIEHARAALEQALRQPI